MDPRAGEKGPGEGQGACCLRQRTMPAPRLAAGAAILLRAMREAVSGTVSDVAIAPHPG